MENALIKRKSRNRAFFLGIIIIGMPQALAADTGKADYVIFDQSIKIFRCYIVDTVDIFHIKINDAATFSAVKVVMRRDIGIKMIYAVANPDLLNTSYGSQKLKVTIYSSKANVRIIFSDIRIDKISGRVIFSGSEKIIDSFALPAVFKFCHLISSIKKSDNISNDYYYDTIYKTGCQSVIVIVRYRDAAC